MFHDPFRRLGLLALLIGGCGGAPDADDGAAGEPLVLPEHYAHSIAAVGVRGAKRSFQIGSGSVAGTGEAGIQWTVTSPRDPMKTSPIYFERDGVPVAHWWVTSARESVHFEAAAVSVPALGDSAPMLVVRVTTNWLDRAPDLTVLEARIVSRADGPSFIPWDASPDTSFVEAWSGNMALRNGRVVAIMAPNRRSKSVHPSRSNPATTTDRTGSRLVAHYRERLGPGHKLVKKFMIPAYPLEPAIAARVVKQLTFGRAAATSRAMWRAQLAEGATLHTPDSLVNAAWRAGVVTLLLSQERAGDDTIAIGNPFQYRDVWLRDGAQMVRALAVAGQTRLARADAWAMRRFQLPNGALVSQTGQLDGTGQALWAFVQAATLPPDETFARRVLPYAARGLEWIERQRAYGRELKLPWAGLLPYANPRDNEMARAQLVGNDAWAFAGENAVAELARLAGDRALEAQARASLDDYRATFGAALARTHQADVPPSWQGIGRDWGNFSVGYPARLLPPTHPRLEALAARVWRGGAGLTNYGTRDSIHSYVAADLAEWALLADRPADAQAMLAGLLAHASSTLGHAEIFGRDRSDFGTNLPPHGTAAARLVQLVRDMIVFDVRDTLELALGAPPSWWSGTRLTRAPTRFGVIDLALSRPSGTRLEASWSAVGVPTRIRVPDGVRAVLVHSPGARIVQGRWIECPPGTTRAAFEIEPEPAP